jgi:hypothetical protein
VIVSLLIPAGMSASWEPALGAHVVGPCAGRRRTLPDGPWIVYRFFPGGFPGPLGPFPEDLSLPGPRPAIAP